MRRYLIAAASAAALLSVAHGRAWATSCVGTFSATGAAETCTVATAGDYLIEAFGAPGGSGAYAGSAGAVASGVYALAVGATLTFSIGEAGASAAYYGGGGGGSFVLDGSTVLLVGGGGGGGGYANVGAAASLTAAGTAGTSGQGYASGAGGTGGNGGQNAGGGNSAAAGGGILGNGANGQSNFGPTPTGGAGLPEGLAGGNGGTDGGNGGFGGGGGGGRGGGGGAGGYSGGGGGNSYGGGGGGGGSFFDSLPGDGYIDDGSTALDTLTGNGEVIISSAQAVPEPATLALLTVAAGMTAFARRRARR